jgi:ferric-dicitrate binding protein FerR (iron transport regulator)
MNKKPEIWTRREAINWLVQSYEGSLEDKTGEELAALLAEATSHDVEILTEAEELAAKIEA